MVRKYDNWIFSQNHGEEFKSKISLFEWMSKWGHQEDDTETIRGTLGRLLFSQDDINKPLSVLSGGEQRRMLFGKIILQRANVIILDEPTNHLDMESIESLNQALGIFEGTSIFVSHDREFISSLATRIIEIKMMESLNIVAMKAINLYTLSYQFDNYH